ncbi:hypothetical protein EP837_02098 [Sphingobium sp. EP60837]|nr:hypothetical protein EP837_02098 [Sphingobium sp. EP60837]
MTYDPGEIDSDACVDVASASNSDKREISTV